MAWLNFSLPSKKDGFCAIFAVAMKRSAAEAELETVAGGAASKDVTKEGEAMWTERRRALIVQESLLDDSCQCCRHC